MFDLSNYRKDSKFFDPDNEKGISKMKDVSRGKIYDEFVGLKSRMQSIKDVDGKETKTRKGVNKNVVKNIKYGKYIDVLFSKKLVRYNIKRNHVIEL